MSFFGAVDSTDCRYFIRWTLESRNYEFPLKTKKPEFIYMNSEHERHFWWKAGKQFYIIWVFWIRICCLLSWDFRLTTVKCKLNCTVKMPKINEKWFKRAYHVLIKYMPSPITRFYLSHFQDWFKGEWGHGSQCHWPINKIFNECNWIWDENLVVICWFYVKKTAYLNIYQTFFSDDRRFGYLCFFPLAPKVDVL